MKKKRYLILLIVMICVFLGLIATFFTLNRPVSSEDETVSFIIKNGQSKFDIAENLKSAGVIRSKSVAFIYSFIYRNLQAGTYNINKHDSTKDVIKQINDGKTNIVAKTLRITFVEGKRFPYYIKNICEKFGFDEKETMNYLASSKFLNKVIDKYDFVGDEILNKEIYYPLEGYIYPDTYDFYENSSIDDIMFKMLDKMQSVIKTFDYEKSDYSLHELLTLASIVEVEGINKNDRSLVASVFYNRLKNNEQLGSDATTYYAAKVDFSDRDLYAFEISDKNAYNTRTSAMAGKLPVGPICSPSKESINAVINPEDSDYYFFVADKNKKTYFTKTYAEHQSKIAELKNNGLWYTY